MRRDSKNKSVELRTIDSGESDCQTVKTVQIFLLIKVLYYEILLYRVV